MKQLENQRKGPHVKDWGIIFRLAKSCGLRYLQTLANAYISLQTDSVYLAADEFRVNCKVNLAMYLFEEKDKSVLVSNRNNRGSEGAALHDKEPYREGTSFQNHIVISSLTMVMEATNVCIWRKYDLFPSPL